MNQKARTVLLADDDFDDLDMLDEAFLIAEPSLHILTASSGKEAVSLLLNRSDDDLPNLIVLDYNMPDLTGAEVLDVICRDMRYSTIPKIIWSTSDSPFYRQLCKDKGATHYFKKPHTIEELQSLAKEMLALSSSF